MEPNALQTGTVVDRYTVESLIGEGGMAVVFRVRHNTLGTLHALKVLTLNTRQIRDRLKQEAEFQARLQHPNVVSVTDVIDLGGGHDGLIMEYVDGPSLDVLMQQQRLGLELADQLAVGILAGVGEAHRRGYVHRDLKPANILLKLTPEGYLPKVADFGLAKSFGEGARSGPTRTRTGSTMGTPNYMSPEQVRDSKSVGPRSDLFSVGAILYEMVSGRRAFEGPDMLEIFNAVANGRYVPIRQLVPDLPERMERTIRAAMQIDPRHRPATAEALGQIWTGEVIPGEAEAQTLPFSGADLAEAQRASAARKAAARTAGLLSAEILRDSELSSSDSLQDSRTPLPWSGPGFSPKTIATSGVAWAVGLGGGMMMATVAIGLVALAIGGGWFWYRTQAEDRLREVQAPALAAPALPVVAPEPFVAPAALETAADEEALRELGRIVRTDADPEVRREAWTTVVDRYQRRDGDVGLLEETVIWQMDHGDARDAGEAVEIYGRYGTEPEWLLGALGHSSPEVRALAASAMAQVAARADGAIDYGAILSPLLVDPDPEVQRQATRALAELRGPPGE